MESLTTQVASLIVIVGLNFVAALLIWAEYSEHKREFLKYAALAQAFVLLWHIASVVLVYNFDQGFFQTVSVISFFLFTCFYLAIATEKYIKNSRAIYTFCAVATLILFPVTYFWTNIRDLLWLLNGLLLVVTPLVTTIFYRQLSRWLVIFFQTLIVLAFLLSVFYFRLDFQAAGGLFYVLMGIFQSILTVVFIISSARISRRDIAAKEHDYRVFFETVYEVFFKLDEGGVIKEISAPVLQYGLSPENMKGNNLSEYLTDSQLFLSKLILAKAEEGSFEYVGSIISSQGETNCEIITSSVKNSETGSIHFTGSIRNTHERNLLEKQFIEAQRMDSLGLLAGGIAHDFNNLLQGIVGYTELLLKDDKNDEEFKTRGLNTILVAAGTAANLCNQLLQFAGRGVTQKETLDLVEAIRDVMNILLPTCPADLNIEINLPKEPVLVDGDKSQIKQVILNLVKNAIEAVNKNGQISIHLEQCFLDEAGINKYKLPKKFVTGNYHVIRVEDNGVGIKHNLDTRIFDPFYTTKKEGHGLGLSAVSGILRTHKAGIAFESEPDQGSTFWVFFPAIEFIKEKLPDNTVHSTEQGYLILLVDDVESVVEVASVILQNGGNRVVRARNGIEALEILNKHGESFDLVITDIKMPKMDGVELAKNLRELYPGMPIIMTSGFAEASEFLGGNESLSDYFISKPFRAKDFLEAVDKVMQSVRAG